jgi:Ca2+-binding EF-hand superfamily protein
VLLAKDVLGEEQLNKVRAKAISLHSDVISNFVDTSNSAFGQTVLKALFNVVDTNRNGVVDEEELAQALTKLGFEWLKDKQVKGIFERADRDNNGRIDLEEWITEAPKTLRTNLIKLAKKNGGELGFLA